MGLLEARSLNNPQTNKELESSANLPIVSVVMPSYNAEKYILESIYSIKAQTEPNWELIVVDDVSTDNTVSLVQHEAESDKRIHVYRMQENKGPSTARNFGIERANGKFIAFLDADDLLSPTALAGRIAILCKHQRAGASYCNALLINEDGAQIGYISLPPSVNFMDLAENKFPTSLVLLRTSLLRSEGGFDVSLRYGEDWDLWLRLTRTGVNFVQAPGCKVFYRQYSGSHSRNVFQDYSQRIRVLERAWGPDENCINPIPEFKNGLGDAKKVTLKIKRAFPTAMAEIASGNEGTAHQLMQEIPLNLLPLLSPRDLAARCDYLIKRNSYTVSIDRKKMQAQLRQFLASYYDSLDQSYADSILTHLFPSGRAHTARRSKDAVKSAIAKLHSLRTSVLSPKRLVSLVLGEKLISILLRRPFKRYPAPSDSAYFKMIRQQANGSRVAWKPLVSVVTPSYNHAEFIMETLDSVKNQDYPKIEHIVIDGGSDDGTLEILEQRKGDIRYISEPDNGQSDAINKGFKMATGDIIGWLNSDDFYATNDVISSVVKFFNNNPQAMVVYGLGDFVDKSGNLLREAYVHKEDKNLKSSFAWAVGMLQPCVFFRKPVFAEVGYLDENNHTSMDYELWLRITQAGIKMHFLDKKIAKARYHEDMKSSKTRGKQLSDTLDLVNKYYGFVHPRWINVYATYMATNDVQIISSKSLDGETLEAKKKIKDMEQELTHKYNSSPKAIRALTDSELCDQKIAAKYLNEYLPDWQSMLKGDSD